MPALPSAVILSRMTVQAQPGSLERELEYRKKLTAITNQINAAESISHILMTLKDRILELADAERLTIYAVDTKNQELYSLQKVGDQPKEIRVPKSFSSIAGFTALARKTINIKDAYDATELARFHANLRFDQRWDKQTGFRTRAVLAVPILFEKYLLGVVQLINKRHGVAFTAQDEDAAEEIARILGIAFYNQHRATRQTKPSRFGALIDKGIISEKDIEAAVSNARVNNTIVEKVLIEDYNVPKEEIGKSLAQFYNASFFNYDGNQMIASDLRERVPSDMWKKYICAPVERRPGMLVIAVDDPHDLTRLDGIRAMNLAPRYDFWVGMKHEILAYIGASYGEAEEAAADSADLTKILDLLGEGELTADEEERDKDEIDETDSGIVKLANQLILEAAQRGASDIHIEPEGAKNPCLIRLRIDGDCAKFMEIPGAYPIFSIGSGFDAARMRMTTSSLPLVVGVGATRSSIPPLDGLKRILPSCGLRRSEMSSLAMILRRCTRALRCAPGISMNLAQSPSMRRRMRHGFLAPSGSMWMSEAPRCAASRMSWLASLTMPESVSSISSLSRSSSSAVNSPSPRRSRILVRSALSAAVSSASPYDAPM